MKINVSPSLIILLRLVMGWIFMWAFIDKLLGLGFATASDKSWLSGTSPTTGFLKFGTHGPFKPFFESLAGNVLVDWLFMLALLALGVALIFGIAMKLASVIGSILMILMWLSLFPPENNPVVDDHIVYALVLLILSQLKSGDYFGYGKNWQKSQIVKDFKFFE